MDDTFDFFIRVIYRMEHGPQIEAYRRWLAELEKAKYIFLNTPLERQTNTSQKNTT